MRQYLDTLFPDEATYLHITGTGSDGKTKTALISKDRDQVVDIADSWTKNRQLSVYIALACYSTYDTDARQRFYRKPHTIAYERDFVVLDFDIKDQLPQFADIGRIITAVLATWSNPLAVVSSGGGVHFYYRYAGPHQITDVQSAIKEFFGDKTSKRYPVMDQRAGLTERDIIRLPGGYNFKRSMPVTARFPANPTTYKNFPDLSVERTRQMSGDLLIEGVPPHNATPYTVEASFHSAVLLADIYAGCEVMRQIKHDAGFGFMHQGTPILNREDALTFMAVHKFADDTDAYAECEKVLINYPNATASYLQTQYDSVNYPRGCLTFTDQYKPKCLNCEYRKTFDRDTMATPLGAGRRHSAHAEAAAAAPEPEDESPNAFVTAAPPANVDQFVPLAHGYTIDSAGLYVGAGNRLVCDKPFRVHRGHVQTDRGRLFTIENINNGERHNILLKSQVNGQLDQLAHYGFVPISRSDNKNRQAMYNYVHAAYALTRPVLRNVGWGSLNRQRGFAFPETTMVEQNGVVTRDVPPILDSDSDESATLPPHQTSAGAWWAATSELYFTYPEMHHHAEMVLASFASVLYHVYASEQVRGHTLLLYGAPNSGKSQALRTAHQVWGRGDKTNTKSDSSAFLLNTLVQRRHLPVTFDDLMREGYSLKVEDIMGLLHMVTEGKTRGRARIDGTAADPLRYACMLLGTANVSMRASLLKGGGSSEIKAASDRLTEHYIKDLSKILALRGIDIIETSIRCGNHIEYHAGSAGREFILHILANYRTYQQVADGFRQIVQKNTRNRHEINYLAMLHTAYRALNDMGRLTLTPTYAAALRIGTQSGAVRVHEAQKAKSEEIESSMPTIDEVIAHFTRSFQDVVATRTAQGLDMTIVAKDVSGASTSMRAGPHTVWIMDAGALDSARAGGTAYVMREDVVVKYLLDTRSTRMATEVIAHWTRAQLISRRTLKLPVATSDLAKVVASCIVVYQ